MENNKLILNYCKNFDYIMNTDFLEGDIHNEDDINKAILIDTVMGKYVEDYTFRKKLQEEMHQIKVKKGATDIIRTIVDGLIDIFRRYEVDATRKIYISKWI